MTRQGISSRLGIIIEEQRAIRSTDLPEIVTKINDIYCRIDDIHCRINDIHCMIKDIHTEVKIIKEKKNEDSRKYWN